MVDMDYNGTKYVYMFLCDMLFVSFINTSDVNTFRWNSTSSGRVSVAKYIALLIGSVRESGSRDGLRDEVLFESTLLLAVVPMGQETPTCKVCVWHLCTFWWQHYAEQTLAFATDHFAAVEGSQKTKVSICLCMGPVGSGKTTLMRHLHIQGQTIAINCDMLLES